MKKLFISEIKNIKLEAYGSDVFLVMDFLSEDFNRMLNLKNDFFREVEFKAFSKEKKQLQSSFHIPEYVFDLSDKAYDKINSFIDKENINNIFFDIDYKNIPNLQKYDYEIIPVDYYHQLSIPYVNEKLNNDELSLEEILNKVEFENPISFSKINNIDKIKTEAVFDYKNELVYQPTDYKLVNARKIKDYCCFDNNTMLLFVNASSNVSSENYTVLKELKTLSPDFYIKLHTILSENNFNFDRLFFKIIKNNEFFEFDGLFYHDGFNNLTFVEKEKIKTLNLNNNSKKRLLKLV